MSDRVIPMAWNEPGKGNKPQDPWGRKKAESGPPDIDKILQNLFNKFSKKFGGGGSGGSGISSPFGNLGIGLIAGILLVLYVVSGLFIVQPTDGAVITRFGKYHRTETPGLHWVPSFVEKVIKVNTSTISSTKHGGSMLTADENIVEIEIAVQYRVAEPENFLFSAIDPVDSLRQSSDSALRDIVGQSKLDYILTSGRSQIAEDIKRNLEKTLGLYNVGFEISDVAIKYAKAPEPVKEAFDDVIKAREERESSINEAMAYTNKVEPIARGRAERMLQEAEAYKEEARLLALGDTARFDLILPEYRRAPQVTKTRLYLETMEEVLEKSSKIIIDLDSGKGSNSLIYLPIDKLMENGARANVMPNLSANFTENAGETVTNPELSRRNKYKRSRG